jgi:hypothetical protein
MMLLRATLAVILGACAPSAPVTWGETQSLDPANVPGAVLAFAATGEPIIITVGAPDSATGGRRACERSVVMADDGAGGAFAAWWEERDDRSVILLVARRARGGERTWGPPVVADDRDRGQRGCDRPPPAIAADGGRGHVHVAYFVEPRDGPGVYAGHSMEDGAYFHGPVVIVYGDRPARTSVDVEGDLVVVAHEDPNSVRPRVAIAISETAGHLIEHRLTVPTLGAANSPLITVAGQRIAVAWTVAGDPPSTRLQVRVAELSARATHPGMRSDG